MNIKKRAIATTLAAVMLLSSFSLSGCSSGDISDVMNQMKIGNGGVGSAWINSDVVGAIDENTPTNPKDDFYTAVNKDWILARKPDETGQVVDLFAPMKIVNAQLVTLVTDAESTGYKDNSTVGMDAGEIAHVGEIVGQFVSVAADEETRNRLGVEPLRPFIEEIEKLNDIGELTEFLCDINGRNALGAPFTDLVVERTTADPDRYTLKIKPVNVGLLTMKSPIAYRQISADNIRDKEIYSELVRNVLEKLGYTKREANAVIRKGLRFEMRLSQKMVSEFAAGLPEYESENCVLMPPEEAAALLGNYPMAEILQAYGLDGAEEIMVCEPKYMKQLARLYAPARLEEMKAYYILHTVVLCTDLLDVETKDETYRILNRTDSSEEPEDPLNVIRESREEKEAKALYEEYLSQYIPAPFEMLYIAAYCSGEQKEALCSMVRDVKAALRETILSEEWLSETAKNNCTEKLDNMSERILFPDSYISYKGLDLSGDETLIEMVRDAQAYEIKKQASLIGKEVDRDAWDLKTAPTTTVNAVNILEENAICIFAGICAGGILFDADAPYEKNLAKLGTTVGHEMTHGFDSNGFRFDKYGRQEDMEAENPLMSSEDRAVFTKKIFGLSTWYSAISPLPGVPQYSGGVVPEAIADMGGMRCALRVAGKQSDFDYDLFFRSYAEVWRKVCTEDMERLYIQGDVHPLAYLRCNITVQQFDEFQKTYGVKEGDGMYLAPENRICLW